MTPQTKQRIREILIRRFNIEGFAPKKEVDYVINEALKEIVEAVEDD